MKKTKIKLIIFPGFFLPHIGGVETHVDEFCKYLSKKNDYEITIFAPNIPNSKEKEIIHNRVKVLRYPAFELVSNWPVPKFWTVKFWKMYSKLYKEDFDITMTRTRFFTNSFLGLFFSKFRFKQTKLIHVEHGSEFVKLESKFKSFLAYTYDMIFGRLIFLMSDKTIAISKTVQDFIYQNFLNEKKHEVQIIKRGVDFEIYKKTKVDLNLKKKFKDKIIMGFVGRLYKWKGVENSIDAYKRLDEKLQKKSVLVIIGNGEDIELLKSRAEIFLDNGIYFMGEKSFDLAISSLKSIDIYVHSAYRGGGLSNSLLQAMECGCAIIASPNEGANEIIFDKKTGILLKNNSQKEIKDAMEILLEDSTLRKKYSTNAKKYVRANFSWEKVIKKYDKLSQEVLK